MAPGRTALVGRGLVLLVAALLVVDGAVQLVSPPVMVEAFLHIGYPAHAGPYLAIVTLTCAALLVPRATAPLGAILTTGFLGGAISAHARLGEIGSPPQLICLALGAAAWGGLVLCDPRVRAMLMPRRASGGVAAPALGLPPAG